MLRALVSSLVIVIIITTATTTATVTATASTTTTTTVTATATATSASTTVRAVRRRRLQRSARAGRRSGECYLECEAQVVGDLLEGGLPRALRPRLVALAQRGARLVFPRAVRAVRAVGHPHAVVRQVVDRQHAAAVLLDEVPRQPELMCAAGVPAASMRQDYERTPLGGVALDTLPQLVLLRLPNRRIDPVPPPPPRRPHRPRLPLAHLASPSRRLQALLVGGLLVRHPRVAPLLVGTVGHAVRAHALLLRHVLDHLLVLLGLAQLWQLRHIEYATHLARARPASPRLDAVDALAHVLLRRGHALTPRDPRAQFDEILNLVSGILEAEAEHLLGGKGEE